MLARLGMILARQSLPSHTEHRGLLGNLDDRLDDLLVLEEWKPTIGGSDVALLQLATSP